MENAIEKSPFPLVPRITFYRRALLRYRHRRFRRERARERPNDGGRYDFKPFFARLRRGNERKENRD
jgi:hypothetical protein